MRRHAGGRSAPAAPPGPPPSRLLRGVIPLHPDDWAWLHDLIRRHGETRR